MNFSGDGCEQSGWRPGLVYQNNTGNQFSPNIIALPLTSALKKENLPTHVKLPKSIGLKTDSMVLCENPERVSKERIGFYITTVPKEYLPEIIKANLLASSAIAYISPEQLLATRELAVSLNHLK